MLRKLESLSCIIPALNEYENLQVLLPKLQETLTPTGVKLKIILVDDGSTDLTPLLFEEYKNKLDLQYIQFSRNFGKESAIAAGLAAVNNQAAVILDADMQHPPSLILEMIKHWQEGYDMVYTYRKSRDEEGVVKRVGTNLMYKLFFGNNGVPHNAGDFRLMDIKVVQALNQLPEKSRFSKGLYHWVGFSTKALPYLPDERKYGKSRFNFIKLALLALDGITSFSVKPLRLTLFVGAILSIFGFVYMFWLIIAYFLYDTIKGFTTIVVLICALFGMLFILLGVIGEYIGKIFQETKHRPLYIVEQNLFSPSLLAAQKESAYYPQADLDLSKVPAHFPEAATEIAPNSIHSNPTENALELAQQQAQASAQKEEQAK